VSRKMGEPHTTETAIHRSDPEGRRAEGWGGIQGAKASHGKNSCITGAIIQNWWPEVEQLSIWGDNVEKDL